MRSTTSRDRRWAAQVLGLGPDAPDDQARRAWLRLVRRHHPDVGGDRKAFDRVQEAWETWQTTAPVRGRAPRVIDYVTDPVATPTPQVVVYA
jgi:hypothetical protein